MNGPMVADLLLLGAAALLLWCGHRINRAQAARHARDKAIDAHLRDVARRYTDRWE